MVFDKRSIVALKKKIVNVNPFFKRFSSFWIEWWLPISIASFDAWNVRRQKKIFVISVEETLKNAIKMLNYSIFQLLLPHKLVAFPRVFDIQ